MRADVEVTRRMLSLLVPAAHALPSNAEYLAHLDIAAGDGFLIRLASNENTELPSPHVREALERSYTDANLSPPARPLLRTVLAERYGLSPDGVLLGAGSTEVIDATLRAFVRAGDEVVLPRPTWPVFSRRLVALEARIVEVPLRSDELAYAFDVDALLAAVTERTKLIVVCSPNNPTGNSMSLADLRRCAGLGLPLLLDAAYADFDQETDPTQLVGEYNNVILSRTFSKAYCLAGLRIGYIVGDPRILDYVDRFLVPGSSVSSAGLHAGLAALEDDDHHRAQVARIVAARDRLVLAVRALGFRAYDSSANFVAVDASSHARGAEGLAAELLERGILVRPLGEGIVRITVGRDHENEAVLGALGGLRRAAR